MDVETRVIAARAGLAALIAELQSRGYRVVGPIVREQAIVYGELSGVDDLAAGWTDEQNGGYYRIKRRGDEAFFGYAVGPHSFKQFLHVPRQSLWRSIREDGHLRFEPVEMDTPHYAFLGVRSCEIHAIDIQDRVLRDGAYPDPYYSARRRDNFIVALNCGQAGGTCFCVSMGTGPKAEHGFDLALTELLDSGGHELLVEAGSGRGAEVLARLGGRSAGEQDLSRAQRVIAKTARQMGRTLDARAAPELLRDNLEHPRWDEVAERCLSCGNCTQVCPTCFCTTNRDVSDLTGDNSERVQQWDSCFTLDFSYLNGGSVRQSTRSRYRQWLTHKLSTWFDQFGTSGCVGCGRCITWCPVGIDMTEEVRAIGKKPP